MITIVKDKDLIWDVENFEVVLIGTTVYCKLDAGFQSKMRFKYPVLDEMNNRMPYADMRRLGTRLTFEDITPIVSLLYICGYPSKKFISLNYESLENCLWTANNEFKGKKVCSTIIGSTIFDGNGDKDKCLELIEKSTPDLDLYLYDYTQLSRSEEIKRQTKYIRSFYESDYEKYKLLKNNEDQLLKRLYLR